MTIYEELEGKIMEAERESRDKTYTLAEREYYAGKEVAFREVLEMFDKRVSPMFVRYAHNNVFCLSFKESEISDFLPPERK